MSEKFDGDTAGLEKVEPLSENVVGESFLEQIAGSPVVSEKVDGDMVVEEKVNTSLEKVIGEACALVQPCTDNITVQQPINVDKYPSPVTNVDFPNPTLSVIFMVTPDPNMCYKNNDQKRGQKWSRFLGSPYVDPMQKKKKKSQDSGENLNDGYIRFMSYLKKKYQTM
ncbi:hypothetical protein Ddye_008194 [Dipteronia dyeriana]|uniref:Uncharacterized protein n=1 Tax=Dipteronia dyeriana TaxID=168575 RepID=A0AAD9X9D0_9ROSI|nr:hypothetical protein Ddye_008194 [Dipteronia dyeriana]